MKSNFTLCNPSVQLPKIKIPLLTLLVFTLSFFYSISVNANDSNNGHYGSSSLSGTESLRTNLYLLNTSNNSTILADGVYTEYNDLYHDSVMLEDAYKFTNINENLGLSRYGSTLAVERRPLIVNSDTLYFRLWKTTQRFYQFEFVPTNLAHPGMDAVLQDSYLGTSQPLSLTGTTKVNFSVNANAASASPNRFRIIYSTNVSSSPLPVTFTALSGSQISNKILINYKVENEINIKTYEVEHSVNGQSFTKLADVAINAGRDVAKSYSYVDETPGSGNNFYRIVSIDKDGSKKYSQIIKVTIGKTGKGVITIYPNPVKGNMINLQFTNELTGDYQVRLINSNGQAVYAGKFTINSSNISQTLLTNQQLQTGIYQLEIIKPNNSVEVKRAIVQQ
ncbi:MAG: T9SS type A sorting domain-containing protein [Ferruginibacter sp.]